MFPWENMDSWLKEHSSKVAPPLDVLSDIIVRYNETNLGLTYNIYNKMSNDRKHPNKNLWSQYRQYP